MKRKLVLSVLIFVFAAILFAPRYAKAQEAADIFINNTDPHAVCDFYRSSQANIPAANGQVLRPVIERESDNECLTSLGSGKQKVFTQFYYSGNNWCWQMYQGGESIYNNCVQRPDRANDLSGLSNNLSSYFTDESVPYIVTGFVVLVIIIAVLSTHKPPLDQTPTDTSAQDQSPTEKPPEYRAPQSVRGKTYKPKGKKTRIWDDLTNAKPGHKHKK